MALSVQCPNCGIAIPVSLDLFRNDSVACKKCGSSFNTAAAFDALAKARADATAAAMLESDLADSRAAYLSRGRTPANLSDDEVQRRWQEAFRDFVNNQQDTTATDDCAAELGLRGLEPDTKPVHSELETLRAIIIQDHDEFPEGPLELMRKIADYRRKSRDKPN
jgi:hypothetical protein